MTDRDRLIEVVARALILTDDAGNPDAILASTEHGGDCTEHPWTCPLCEAEEYRTLARAAILATLRGIREPTREMCNAGIPINCTGLPTGDWREGICAAPNCSCYEKHGMRIVPATYRAMIDRLIQDFAPEGKGE